MKQSHFNFFFQHSSRKFSFWEIVTC
jgi:hypothetical protein